mmetsp:Transcript_5687/g.15117  ORF Transcript_5687/g.15117 Transcript_5687/m.15117 type:complete len:84 (+) Transcript_5687:189-440(+)
MSHTRTPCFFFPFATFACLPFFFFFPFLFLGNGVGGTTAGVSLSLLLLATVGASSRPCTSSATLLAVLLSIAAAPVGRGERVK